MNDARRIKIIDGKVVTVPSTDRQMMKDMIDMMFGDIDEKDARIRELRRKLEEPTDERLAQAYAIIEEMREEYDRLRRKSFIAMSDGQYDDLEKWKTEHWRSNEKCQRMRLRYVRSVVDEEMIVTCNICGATFNLGKQREESYPSVFRFRPTCS